MFQIMTKQTCLTGYLIALNFSMMWIVIARMLFSYRIVRSTTNTSTTFLTILETLSLEDPSKINILLYYLMHCSKEFIILEIFLRFLTRWIVFCRHETKTLREDAFGNMFIYGSTEIEVRSASEAIDAFNRGQKRRRVAATQVSLGYEFAKTFS